MLNIIRTDIAGGASAAEAVERWLPCTAKKAPVLKYYRRWLKLKWQQVEAGDRSPRTITEYERYARKNSEMAFWEGVSVYEIDYARLEDWNIHLTDRGRVSGTQA